jgi:hypothetical protein
MSWQRQRSQKQAATPVCDKLNVVGHELGVHPNQGAGQGVTDKLVLKVNLEGWARMAVATC